MGLRRDVTGFNLTCVFEVEFVRICVELLHQLGVADCVFRGENPSAGDCWCVHILTSQS